MTSAFDPAAPTIPAVPRTPTLGRKALVQLRLGLERELGTNAARLLQDAGFAAGEEHHAAFSAWLAQRTDAATPDALDARHFGEALAGFLQEQGWGALTVHALADGVLALDSADWAEATSDTTALAPSCHFTCGLLADLLGRIAGDVVAVMEVECRSRGDARCRFLAGSPETLGALYERIAAGDPYLRALGVS